MKSSNSKTRGERAGEILGISPEEGQAFVDEADKTMERVRPADRYEKIEPTLRQILICAREHRLESVHLDAIAKILEEWLK